MARRGRDWLSLGPLGAGAFLLLIVLWFSWGEYRFAAGAERVASIVVQAPQGAEDDPARSYGRIAFDYRGARHERAIWPGSGSGTLPEDSIPGDWQTVLVPPGAPGEARMADWANRYALKITLFGFGAILLLIGNAARLMKPKGLGFGDVRREGQGVALSFLALGLAIAAGTAVAAWQNKAWIDRSRAAIGVAEARQGRTRVIVTDRDGRRWAARASFLPPQLPPGRDRIAVPIRHDPAEPYSIRPFATWPLWSTYAFLGGFAAAFCAVPLLGLWLLGRHDEVDEDRAGG